MNILGGGRSKIVIIFAFYKETDKQFSSKSFLVVIEKGFS